MGERRVVTYSGWADVRYSGPAGSRTRRDRSVAGFWTKMPGLSKAPVCWSGMALQGFFSVPVFTDRCGVFQASGTVYPPPFNDYGDEVLITRDGYEATDGWAPGTTDVTQDFRLYQPLTVTAGEAVHLTIGPDNSLCGLEIEFRCRPIYIRAPTSGTVVLDTVPDDPGFAFWITVGGPSDVQYPFVGTTHNAVVVPAGSSVVIQVMLDWVSAPYGFTLRTSRIP